MINPKPSIPRIKLIFIELNQELVSINWNVETVGSKKNNNIKLKLRIINDQKREKFRIRLWFVLLIKDKTKHATRGRIVRVNNIKKKECKRIELKHPI
jgi:hypothetical protein